MVMQNIQIQGADRPQWLAIAKIRNAEAEAAGPPFANFLSK
jgi:hypothetical protein